ncbi:hypothetical protein VPH35_062700 [Triticum aestivum]
MALEESRHETVHTWCPSDEEKLTVQKLREALKLREVWIRLLIDRPIDQAFKAHPAFPNLRYLQLNGRALHNDPGHVIIASINTILKQAPNLEHLTLFFEPPPPETHHKGRHQHYFRDRKRVELHDAHHLHYNQYNSLDNALRASVSIAPCRRSRLRRINLVHYQGGRAQRMIALFLLRNALLFEKLYYEFAQGRM